MMRTRIDREDRGVGGGCRLMGGWLLVLVWMGCGGCSTEGSSEAQEVAGNGEQVNDGGQEQTVEKQEKAIVVDVAEVRRGDLVIPIYADGAIRTPRAVEVRSKVGGELVRVDVRDGDHVRAGQVLARIDEREYAINLRESRYRHIRALSRMAAEGDSLSANPVAREQLEVATEELAELRRRGVLSREEYEQRRLELELQAVRGGAYRQELFEQRTGLAEARIAAERAQLDLENTEIRAPFAGIVQGVAVVEGEIIGVNTPVCRVYDNRRLEAVVDVLEDDLGDLDVGRPVRLAIPATGDTLTAQVDVISPQLDESTRTCEVVIRFDNPDDRLRPGTYVRAEIAGFIYPETLMVPGVAVLSRDDRPLVFKVEGDRAQWLYVDTGRENDDWIAIERVHSGGSLAPGDRVIVSDHLTLAHEAKIKVRRTRAPPDRWSFASAGLGGRP